MPKVSTEKMVIVFTEENKVKFQFDINVNKAGIFSAKMPEEVANMFNDAGVEMSSNRNLDLVFFDKSREALMKRINDAIAIVTTKKLLSEGIFLHYKIETTMHYWKSLMGDNFPNGTYTKSGEGKWHEGTNSISYSQLIRIAQTLDAVKFVELPDDVKLTTYREMEGL